MLEQTQETEEIIQRVAALDIGKAELVCCVWVPSPDTPGKCLQEESDLPDDDPVAAGAGGPAGRAGGHPGGDGGDLRLLEARVLSAGGPGV